MTDDFKILEETIEELAQVFQGDGVSFRITGLKDNIARVSLEISPGACRECIVGGDVLRQIIKDMLTDKVPQIKDVELKDPRETD